MVEVPCLVRGTLERAREGGPTRIPHSLPFSPRCDVQGEAASKLSFQTDGLNTNIKETLNQNLNKY